MGLLFSEGFPFMQLGNKNGRREPVGRNLAINRMEFSELFWMIIFSGGISILREAEDAITKKNSYFESLRNQATYNTGSITISTSVTLALLTSYFQPRSVAEVGTFIGRSTFSLALGAQLSGKPLESLHSCDLSNDIELDLQDLTTVVQYPRQGSNQMFSKLVDANIIPDLYFVDGRLASDDVALMAALGAEKAIILLDDFEGTEKGVANAHLLLESYKDNYLLAYPPHLSFLKIYGLLERTSVAALVPKNRIAFVNQG